MALEAAATAATAVVVVVVVVVGRRWAEQADRHACMQAGSSISERLFHVLHLNSGGRSLLLLLPSPAAIVPSSASSQSAAVNACFTALFPSLHFSSLSSRIPAPALILLSCSCC